MSTQDASLPHLLIPSRKVTVDCCEQSNTGLMIHTDATRQCRYRFHFSTCITTHLPTSPEAVTAASSCRHKLAMVASMHRPRRRRCRSPPAPAPRDPSGSPCPAWPSGTAGSPPAAPSPAPTRTAAAAKLASTMSSGKRLQRCFSPRRPRSTRAAAARIAGTITSGKQL